MSTQLFIHEMPEIADGLARRAQSVLANSRHAGVRDMAEKVIEEPKPALNLAFTGQYNAGKSTIISALTGRDDIIIDSDVATAHVREYPWDQVLLVDTPGVQAGRERHDELADRALRSSDMVVFVVSVDLFDDRAVEHFQYVSLGLGKRYSMVLAVNKAGTMVADPAYRRGWAIAAVGEAGLGVPVVITDARDHIDGLQEEDPVLRQELLEMGNMDSLAAQLNGLVTRSGQMSRLRRPFERVSVVCGEAMELLTEDVAEKAARNILNRQRRLALNSRRRLELAFDEEFLDFRAGMRALADSVADNVDALDSVPEDRRQREVDAVEADFRAKASRLADELVAALTVAAEREAAESAEQFGEISASPKLHLLDEELKLRLRPTGGAGRAASSASGDEQILQALRGVSRATARAADFWGPKGGSAGMWATRGSQGHKIVYRVGKAFGKDFKPWEAVRTAQKIGKTLRIVNKAIPFVVLGVEVFTAVKRDQDESRYLRQIQSRRGATLDGANSAAAEVEAELRARLAVALEDLYAPVVDRIQRQESELDEAVGARNETVRQLAAIADECRRNLQLLTPADLSAGDSEQQRTAIAATIAPGPGQTG